MKNAAALLALLLVCSLPAMTLAAAEPAGGGPASDTVPEESLTTNAIDHDGQPATDWGRLGQPVSVTVSDTTGQGVAEADETTNRLVLEGDVRSGYVDVSPDLGATLITQDDAIRIDHDRYAIDETLGSGPSDERQAALEDAYNRTLGTIDELEEREQEAVSQHAEGTLSEEELLIVLVRNQEKAAALSESLDHLESAADRTAGISITARDHQASLDQYQGPVRSQLDMSARGDPAENILLETSATGVSLAMVTDGEYVRETTRFDNQESTQSAEIASHGDAEERVSTYYPWAVTEQPVGQGLGVSTIVDYSQAQLYWLEVRTVQGSLQLYLDTGSGEVFREVQSLSVDELPSTAQEQSWTDGTLEASVNRTPVNGPMEITAISTETDEPVDARVLVDGRVLGHTDGDDAVWLLPPADEFELSVQSAEGRVNESVSGWSATVNG